MELAQSDFVTIVDMELAATEVGREQLQQHSVATACALSPSKAFWTVALAAAAGAWGSPHPIFLAQRFSQGRNRFVIEAA
ncbi:hypothetical protein O9K51_10915 [Purpureocillium lavendulum]|uniref:Uncharacterized protein n=1 Tax=Purpureocillium lavendulum TaxID=1247861 RepID=A0AB34FD11_9HYPO|nr:hypothetical protein O9K51_10915 [Purpureocillium lavendulum]